MGSLDPNNEAATVKERARSGSGGRGGMPMYAQLLALFRQRIENGEWAIDQQIPTLDDLIAEFNVARVTVRHAIGLLEAEGLVGRYRGRGTYVLKRPESAIWYRIPLTWEELHDSVPDIEFEWLENAVAQPPAGSFHGQGEVAPAYQLLRRRLLRHHVPYCIGHTLIEKQAYDEIGGEGFGAPIPLQILDKHLKGGIAHAEQTIRVSIAELHTAELLQLPAGSPVLNVMRSVLNHKGVLIYESVGVFRGDFVEIHTVIK